MLMMRPQPRLAIKGAAAPTSKKALLTLSRNARSKVPASTSGVGAAISVPPLFTSMSTPPKAETVSSTNLPGVPASPRSCAKNTASPPVRAISWTTSRPRVLSRPVTTTLTPASPSRRAISAPIPEVEPVTIATRPGPTPNSSTLPTYCYISSILSVHHK